MNKGQHAEQLAADFLQRKGLKLVAHNYRCRFGEIDLILRDGKTLVFVEVRFRQQAHFGGAAESLNAAKREKLLLTARHYLSQFKTEPACRFDAVLFNGQDENQLEWIQNAISE